MNNFKVLKISPKFPLKTELTTPIGQISTISEINLKKLKAQEKSDYYRSYYLTPFFVKFNNFCDNRNSIIEYFKNNVYLMI